MSDETYMRVGQMGATAEMSIRYAAEFTDHYEPVGFTFETENPLQSVRASGVMDGSTLRIEVRTGGETRTFERDASGVDLFGLKELKAARDGLRVGLVMEGRTLEPASLEIVPYRIEVRETAPVRVGTAETEVFVVSSVIQGIETISWVVRDGAVLRSMGPMGVELRREDERTAREMGAAGTTDLVLRMTIPAAWPATTDARTARRMTVVFGGLDEPLEGMAGGVQTVERLEKGVRVTVDVDRPAAEPPPAAEAMAPTVYVQSDAPRIVEAARAAAGDGTPERRAAALAGWVHRTVEKAPAFTLPSALDVLENPRGDCNEHAVLYAALARAAGIPARIAAGLVWLDGRFYYHAWNEVYLDGAWRPVDATFGQARADAAHVRFVAGDLDAQMRIAAVAGRLTARIESAE